MLIDLIGISGNEIDKEPPYNPTITIVPPFLTIDKAKFAVFSFPTKSITPAIFPLKSFKFSSISSGEKQCLAPLLLAFSLLTGSVSTTIIFAS